MHWYELHEELSKKLELFYEENKNNESGKGVGELFYEKCIVNDEEKFHKLFKWSKNLTERSIDPFHIFASFNNSGTSMESKWERLQFYFDILEIKIDAKTELEDNRFSVPHIAIVYVVSNRNKISQEQIWDFFIGVRSKNTKMIQDGFEQVEHWFGIGFPVMTVFLFWIDSDNYLSLDKNTKALLKKYDYKFEENHKSYSSLVATIRTKSHNALNNFRVLVEYAYKYKMPEDSDNKYLLLSIVAIKEKANENSIIRSLEKKYGIELTQIDAQTELKRNTYKTNDNGEVIALSLEAGIEEIPNFQGLETLTILHLANNKIVRIENLELLSSLQSLHLSENKIRKIENLEKLSSLSELDLYGNEIEKIENLEKLNSLTTLILFANQIAKIENLEKLNSLTTLILFANKIAKIENLEKLNSLITLMLYGNKIEKIENLEKLSSLTVLDLSGNKIAKIENLEKLNALTELDLSSNKIEKIENLEKLSSLATLNLSDNQIEKIKNLEKLSSLATLNLSDNKIEKIENLEKSSSLNELDLSFNEIAKIENIEKLSSLTILDLSYNKIAEIENLEALNSLVNLDLSSNIIKSIDELKNIIFLLKKIKIDNNPFESYTSNIKLYSSLERNHIEAIKNYFELLRATDIVLIKEIKKVMLVGNHASGKSTFLDYFMNGIKTNHSNDSTHILSIERYPKDSEPTAIFYDFGGQDYYHGIYKAFMTNDTTNLIFWKLKTDKNKIGNDSKSENGTLMFNRPYWIRQVKHYGKENKSWLIQTHRDRDKRLALSNPLLQEDIEDEYNVELTMPEKPNLEALRKNLLEEINKTKNIEMSKSYVDFINELFNIGVNEGADELETIEKQFEKVKTQSNTNITLSSTLYQLAQQGQVLYYPNNEALKDKVWLNPQETVKEIHKGILSREHMEGYKGKVPKEEFEKIAQDDIRLLLLENKVVYFDETSQNYIIPSYLPLVKSETDDFFFFSAFGIPQLTLKFEYFIPFGFINQLICHYGQNPDLKKYWRDSLLFTLDKKQIKISIRLNFEELKIEIYVSSSSQKYKETEIIKSIFDDIMAFYYDKPEWLSNLISRSGYADVEDIKIDYTKGKVIYPDDLYISLDNKQFVHFNTLNDSSQTHESVIAHLLDENYTIIKDKQLSKLSTRPFKYLVPNNKKVNEMKKIFISYSKKNIEYKERLVEHMRLLKVFDIADSWDDSRLAENGGKEWHDTIQKELEESDMIVYMLSIDFFNSSYILNHEVANILNKQHGKKILCVLVCDFANIFELSKNIPYNQSRSNYSLGTLELNNYQIAPYDYDFDNQTGNKYKSSKPLCRWEVNTRDSAYAQIVHTIDTILKS